MALTFKELWGEVKQTFPNLSPFLAQRFVQRAVTDIYNSRKWSFLKDEGYLYSPAVISGGSFNITQFQTQITANATAIIALNNLANPLLTQRQIKLGTELYNITAVDANFAANGLLTLDRPVLEPTNATQTYLCYRAYYGRPQVAPSGNETTDFLCYNNIYYPALSTYFRIINAPRERLNRRDPQRAAAGITYYFYTYKAASDGSPQWEMWPHPMNSAYYLIDYNKRGLAPTNPTDVLPDIIEDDIVLPKAMYYGCLWANKNQSRYKELAGVNWLNLAREHIKEYSNIDSRNPGALELAQIRDEESNPEQIVVDNRTSPDFVVGTDDRTGFAFINPTTGQNG